MAYVATPSEAARNMVSVAGCNSEHWDEGKRVLTFFGTLITVAGDFHLSRANKPQDLNDKRRTRAHGKVDKYVQGTTVLYSMKLS